MKQKPEVLWEWLDELAVPKKRLTEWEKVFVFSVTDQLAMRGSLTDKQIDILEKIYTDKT
jgi:hypothetical protein